jgi:hypothetical protein
LQIFIVKAMTGDMWGRQASIEYWKNNNNAATTMASFLLHHQLKQPTPSSRRFRRCPNNDRKAVKKMKYPTDSKNKRERRLYFRAMQSNFSLFGILYHTHKMA